MNLNAAHVDVVIAGAGPAGLAAGIVLARNGIRTLVCDPKPLPIDKACGEGVLPHGLACLEQLGVMNHLDARHAHPFRGIRLRTNRAVAEAPFHEGPGLGIRRLNLSRALELAARAWPLLEIRQAPVLGYSALAGGVEVQLPDQRIAARLLIGADGLNSRVRRWAGLEGSAAGVRRYGVRQHFALVPWSDHVEVFFGPGIEAYVTPSGQDTTEVAFLWDKDRYRPKRGGQALVSSHLAAFPELADRFQHAPVVSPPLSTGPLHRKVRARTADGVLLLGDAGGYLDACTGEGISLALAQALALEKTVAPLLTTSHGSLTRRQLGAFECSCREIASPYVFGTNVLMFFGRRPWLLERCVRTLGRNPDLLAQFYSALMGRASFWPGWSRLLRLFGL